ncbi:methyltransferase [Aggregicoccus sp. 17bor-14]|nr:methyltransferase [Simulacricoccus sp. 17bor-14]MRI89847.1 methyltransferase [Aggregicoccus sp. 17bor-14]
MLQRRTGYRFNLDSLLLAHFAVQTGGAGRGRIIDLGTGCGIVPLLLSRRLGCTDVTGLELQPGLFSLAQRNVHLNRCEHSVSLVLGDLCQVDQKFGRGSFAHVLCNPPYRAPASGRVNTERERALARHELTCALVDVVRAARYLLEARGGLSLVYPVSRFSELATTLKAERLSMRHLRLVHPRPDRPAKLLLLHAVRSSRAPLVVLPPLVVHSAPGPAFSPEVSAMVG